MDSTGPFAAPDLELSLSTEIASLLILDVSGVGTKKAFTANAGGRFSWVEAGLEFIHVIRRLEAIHFIVFSIR